MIVPQFDLKLEQLDVKIIFLYSELEENTYMKQPESYTQKSHEIKVCLLKKSLYGLKHSLRQWYKWFDSFIIKIRYN